MSEATKQPQDLGSIIREHCPVLTETFEKNEPDRQLGAVRTKHLMTYAYGLLLNGYSVEVVTENVNQLYRLDLKQEDIIFIQKAIDFESELASMTLLP